MAYDLFIALLSALILEAMKMILEPKRCRVCGIQMLPREIAAYENRCENCWVGDNCTDYGPPYYQQITTLPERDPRLR